MFGEGVCLKMEYVLYVRGFFGWMVFFFFFFLMYGWMVFGEGSFVSIYTWKVGRWLWVVRSFVLRSWGVFEGWVLWMGWCIHA